MPHVDGEPVEIYLDEIHQQNHQGKPAKDHPCGRCCYQCAIITMAGGAAGFCTLHPHFSYNEKNSSMTYTVQVKVMPLKELLDPQGKAVMGGLLNLGLPDVTDVRVGKNIQLQVEADSVEKAKTIAEEASRKLLANEVMEYFEVEVKN